MANVQRIVAAVCISVLSIIYLAGYVQWYKVTSTSQLAVASPDLARLAPPPTPPVPVKYTPDVALPEAKDGIAPVIYTVPTKLPVVFLTIDDGVYKEPEAAARMKSAHIPASFFLTNSYTQQTPNYFKNLAAQTGSIIEDHTIDHKDLRGLSYEDQRTEICTTADIYQQIYGKRPTIMRPPYGDFNDNTQRATAVCGLKAVIIWHALVRDGVMHYQVGDSLLPGDIVLMHFTPNFKKDLQAFIDASHAASLTPQLLEDWFAN